jgi:hypothetical protein
LGQDLRNTYPVSRRRRSTAPYPSPIYEHFQNSTDSTGDTKRLRNTGLETGGEGRRVAEGYEGEEREESLIAEGYDGEERGEGRTTPEGYEENEREEGMITEGYFVPMALTALTGPWHLLQFRFHFLHRR